MSLFNLEKQEVIFKAENVNLSYGKKQILSNINFEITDKKRIGVNQGQIVSLIGRSGIGKSQLFRIMCGFNEIENTDNKNISGKILINRDLHPVKLGEVGVVTQNYKLLEHRTVRKNLLFTGKSKTEVEDLCKQFDLFQHLDKFPLELSGGQRQRAAILQQVLTGNDFILLDEPFSGLDDIMLKKIISLLLKISLIDELKTLVIISHDIENSLAISDHAFLMTKYDENVGATISSENVYNLSQMGLAWQENIKENVQFKQLIKTIKDKL